MIMNTMHIGSVAVYIERDMDGYVSLSTDAIDAAHPALASIIAALKTLQTPEDREMDAFAAAHDRDIRILDASR